MKFKRGDLVRTTWYNFGTGRIEQGPAIVIKTKSDDWIKVWIPAASRTMVTSSFYMNYYNEARG